MIDFKKFREVQKFVHDFHDHIHEKRKYNNLPYWTHLDQVGCILSLFGHSEGVVIAGLAHDFIESYQDFLQDIGPNEKFNPEALSKMIGLDSFSIVNEVTNNFTKENYPELNRSQRKQREKDRLLEISSEAVCVKLADIYSNLSDHELMFKYDPGFGYIFVKEKMELVKGYRKRLNKSLYVYNNIPFKLNKELCEAFDNSEKEMRHESLLVTVEDLLTEIKNKYRIE